MEGFENESLDFLQAAERQTVQRNIKEIRESNNPLYIGKRVSELHQLLAPFGYFTQAIAATKVVQRTAYGYMYGYQNAIADLPPGAVQAMMDRKLVINANRNRRFGEWTEALQAVPAPLKGSSADYSRWVEEMIAAKPKRVTGHLANRIRRSPDDLLIECDKQIERAFKRLPVAARERFARKLIGVVMRRFGLDTAQRFSPAESLPARSERIA